MSDPAIYPSEIVTEIARVVQAELGAALGLQTCRVGDLVREFLVGGINDPLNAVFVKFCEWEVLDSEDMPNSPPFFEILYHCELVYLRKQAEAAQAADVENPDAEIAKDLAKIGTLFLKTKRRLPGFLLPDGRKVSRIIPHKGDVDTPINALLDTPQLHTSAALINLTVYTRV